MLLEDKKRIFQNDLLEMKDDGFIDGETYNSIYRASNEFYNKKFQQLKSRGLYNTNYINQEEKKIPSINKKVLTEQQIAERKASVLLNLGVVFLFLSGLIFATTNWSNLGLVGKIFSVAFMGSILYLGSFVAEKKLRLEKTSRALWILTTLYIPIVGITFMYSLMWSDGVDIDSPQSLVALGFIAAISTVVNILSFRKYNTKYYIWASYITAELSVLFFVSSLKLGNGYITLVTVAYSFVILYTYMKLKNEEYKKYTRQYLMILNQITTIVLLIFGSGELLKVPYILALISLVTLLIYTSYILKDKFIGITLILFLPLKTLDYIQTLDLDIAFFAIPASLIIGIQYLSFKEKLHHLVGYISIIISFILFNLILFSDTLFYLMGSLGIIVTALITYKTIKIPEIKVLNLNKYLCIVISIYTYVFMARLPFVLYDNMTYIEKTSALSVSAILLCLFQYIINPKYKDIKLAYSNVSILILMANGVNSISNVYISISILIALALFEMFGLSKRFNLVAYFINIFVGVNIFVFMLKYDSNFLPLGAVIGVIATMIVIAYKNKEHKKYLLLCSSIFMAITVGLGHETFFYIPIIIISILLGALSLKEEADKGLFILCLTIAYGIMMELRNPIVDDTIKIFIESLYALVLSILGAKCYKQIKEEKSYDSLSLAAIAIIVILTFITSNKYIDILITTIAALGVVGVNYKKLSGSKLLKLFIILKLISSYIQVVTLSDVKMGDGILIIPLLVFAATSRYYIFKNSNIGYTIERLSLLLLVLKLIANIMNFDTVSAMVVITIGIVVLVISYTKKIKIYFITSISMIILPLIKGSLDFWQLIPWWTYLLVVGIVLLILGSMAEKNKKKNKSLKDLNDKFFKGWN
ncbi:hypothetical protein NNC19_01535 [Clostridium sp. SHJSY1]|uniref:hypothetical protein n=1 Tax=Clostridium sp. SHJSY1 TaxID=2942483 RepID=UPI00287588C6|nr:hypothetical protein [Clostridium sp. SHJSY1]MDS0524341.1 hypothetical protein [Clostridium sp. SHJSY1]